MACRVALEKVRHSCLSYSQSKLGSEANASVFVTDFMTAHGEYGSPSKEDSDYCQAGGFLLHQLYREMSMASS